MGLFSTKSSSSSSSEINENNFNNVDNRVSEGERVNVGGNVSLSTGGSISGVTVTTTDFGALDTANDIASQAFQMSGKSNALASTIANRALDFTNTSNQDDFSKTLRYLIFGGVILGAILIYRGR
jgi:hypothetical protein